MKRTAQVHEMLAQLQMTWAAPPQAGDTDEESFNDGLRSSAGAATHSSDGNSEFRSRGSSDYGMRASSTPAALRGVVGSTAASQGPEVINLPRPGEQDSTASRRSSQKAD